MILEFEIKGLPKMINQLMVHWRVKHAESRKWKLLVAQAVVPIWPKTNPALTSGVSLALTRYSTREPDFDGLVSGFKHVLDGLVEVGVLLNDKPSVIGQPTYSWEYARPKAGKIKVRIERKAA